MIASSKNFMNIQCKYSSDLESTLATVLKYRRKYKAAITEPLRTPKLTAIMLHKEWLTNINSPWQTETLLNHDDEFLVIPLFWKQFCTVADDAKRFPKFYMAGWMACFQSLVRGKYRNKCT